jgi:hypothetical protein
MKDSRKRGRDIRRNWEGLIRWIRWWLWIYEWAIVGNGFGRRCDESINVLFCYYF